MFERFTETAIKVIMLSQEEARRLNHNFVGTSPDLTIATTTSGKTTSDLETLLVEGCNWLRDYLTTNPNLSESDRHLCDGIGTQN